MASASANCMDVNDSSISSLCPETVALIPGKVITRLFALPVLPVDPPIRRIRRIGGHQPLCHLTVGEPLE